jgi:hypothetical protein
MENGDAMKDEYDFSTAERGRHGKRRKPKPGEIVRLAIVGTLTWDGDEPEWPSTGRLTFEAPNATGIMKKDGEKVVLDFSHPAHTAIRCFNALRIGSEFVFTRDGDFVGRVRIEVVRSVVARGDGFVEHIERATTLDSE